MKDIWKNGIVVLLVIAVLYIIFLRECKRTDCPPKGQVLISQQAWDSIKALANKPPVVTIDTVWLEKPTVTPKPQPPIPTPQPSTQDTTINMYQDSLINKEINVWSDLWVRGTLIDRKWRYSPITVEIRRDSIIYVPKIVDNPILVQRSAMYVYGLAGGNEASFLFGGGLDYITKKGTEFGGMYQTFGSNNFYSVKVGVKIQLKK